MFQPQSALTVTEFTLINANSSSSMLPLIASKYVDNGCLSDYGHMTLGLLAVSIPGRRLGLHGC